MCFRFEKDEFLGGRASLLQDGVAVGEGKVKRYTPVAFNELMIGLTCGYEWGPAVGADYEAPFAFNGTIVRAEVTATGPVVRDPVAEVAAILASQVILSARPPGACRETICRVDVCANCMAHRGYESSAVLATTKSLRQMVRAAASV